MSECTHDCSSCSQNCSERKDFREKLNELSSVKKVIGIVSGKGGVGKSFVTSTLAVLAKRKGFKTAILDADITGPSIPKMFGKNEKAQAMDDKYLLPVISKTGIQMMSINLLLENESDPVVGVALLLQEQLSSFGRMLFGLTWIICLSICLQARVTFHLLFSNLFPLME